MTVLSIFHLLHGLGLFILHRLLGPRKAFTLNPTKQLSPLVIRKASDLFLDLFDGGSHGVRVSGGEVSEAQGEGWEDGAGHEILRGERLAGGVACGLRVCVQSHEVEFWLDHPVFLHSGS